MMPENHEYENHTQDGYLGKETVYGPEAAPSYKEPISFLPPILPGNTSTPPAASIKSRKNSILVLAVLVAALVGGLVGGSIVDATGTNSSSASSSQLQVTDQKAPASAIVNTSSAAAKIIPSVVTIKAVDSTEEGVGSGVVLQKDGYILTNNHVVSLPSASSQTASTPASLTVLTSAGKTASATIVGTDPEDDLAVIKVTGLTLTPATFTKSSNLSIGQDVLAIGAPLGLSGTVTSGIVSALNRTVRSGNDNNAVFTAIQTDASINPGNSGGALVDLSGNVVGINAAIASESSQGLSIPGQQTSQSGSIGLGFAIPSDEAFRIATEILKTGKASHAALGVTVQSSTTATTPGATLASVATNSAASKAGLKAGDVISKVGTIQVVQTDDLLAAIRSYAPGQTVSVEYERNNTTKTIMLILGQAF